MTHLRSPAVHHLGDRPGDLRAFAGRRWSRSTFRGQYNRPSLELFNAHCDHLIERHALAERHVQARASRLDVDDDGASVRLNEGEAVRARRVVLALGAGDQLTWPDCCPDDDDRFRHIFDEDLDAGALDRAPSSPRLCIAVLGGGISAAQVALRAHRAGHDVEVIARHEPREHNFDSEPGWLGPKHMVQFEKEKSLSRRRSMITEARHRGSVPPDVCRGVRTAKKSGRFRWHSSPIDDVDAGEKIRVRLRDGTALTPDLVFLATGFEAKRPGGALLDDAIEAHGLPCADCGYPIVDRFLAWHPALYTTGPLAELELGPVARNIAGARRAADRIVEVARAG